MTDLSIAAHDAERRFARLTPAGIQPLPVLLRRRLFFAIVACTSWCAIAWGIFLALGLDKGGWPMPETAVFLFSLLGIPWSVIGFWNALIGFWLLRREEEGLREAAPYWRFAHRPVPLSLKVAVVLTIRNEDPARAMARLYAVRESLDETGEGEAFDYFVLSDTSIPAVAKEEERLCEEWRRRYRGDERLTYRRRERNEGYKAGNVRDFLTRWGDDYDVMITLDADSVMSASAILGLVRVMQAFPRLGILQSLISGTPAKSAFARMFQFGMRHSMRSYTMGSAWWTADCGPYWGHNAAVRIRPFKRFCLLPQLPGKPPLGGHILSHDQIEAAFMRKAGYEVRVAPVEAESFEDNPPTLIEFCKRDMRWCQGNLQYLRLVGYPGLKILSRFQILLAIIMYLGSAASAIAVTVLLAAALLGGLPNARPDIAAETALAMVAMGLTPYLIGLADAMSRARTYGGLSRLLAGSVIGVVFSTLLSPIMTLRSVVFTISLLFGKSVSWGGQTRDAHGLSWKNATRELWPQTVIGLAVLSAVALCLPKAFLWALPVFLGLALAIPFAVFTASPRLGQALASMKLCGIPEEFHTVRILESLQEKEAASHSSRSAERSSDPEPVA